MHQSSESVGENTPAQAMVTNAELAKKVEEQEEDNNLLRQRIAKMEQLLGEVQDKADRVKEKIDLKEEAEAKEKELELEEEAPAPDPILPEEPFLKALKALSGKALEGVPLFSGQMDPDSVVDWIDSIENHFECDGISEAQKVMVAKSRLRGSALTWWKFVQTEREKDGKGPIVTWKGMVSKVKQTYLPDDYEVQMHRRRQNLRQKDLDVQAYTEEFQKLCLRSKVVEDESIKLARYLNGLKWSIQEEMSLVNFKSIRQCYQMALKIEEKSKRKQDSSKGKGKGKDTKGQRGGYGGRSSDSRAQGEVKFSEQQEGSSSRGGRGRNSNSNFRGRSGGSSQSGRGNYFANMKCYHCNQMGHPAYRCPEKGVSSQVGDKRANLVHEDTNAVDKHSKIPLNSKEGENLMMRRTLIKEPVKEEPSQRRSLFRIKCKIMGKVCRVIIDSGSTDNIVSEEAVSKLKLKRISHTNPYKVTWLNKGQDVLVNEQAWVEFSIGRYKDKVLCDVLPMDACHLLLGRPWQFDRQAIHDGGKNSYSFKKDNTTFKIQSLLEDAEVKTAGPNVLMVGEKEFLQTMEEGEGIGYALMLKPREGDEDKVTKKTELPKEIQGMLQTYQGIVSDGQPSALPPQRAISHRIDLIPGATLPNKAAYKMTPQQN